MTNADWTDLLLAHPASPVMTWHGVSQALAKQTLESSSPEELHRATVLSDRILAEAAFDLWEAFPTAAPRTSVRLAQWCTGNKAVLIMDALSLREMKVLVEEAKRRNLEVSAEVTFSEAPSDTTVFAKALGTPTRASLANNGKSASFRLFEGRCSTDSTSVPFEDVSVPPVPSVVIWHSYVDDLIHIGNPIKFDEDAFLGRLERLMLAAYANKEEYIRGLVKDMVSTYQPEKIKASKASS